MSSALIKRHGELVSVSEAPVVVDIVAWRSKNRNVFITYCLLKQEITGAKDLHVCGEMQSSGASKQQLVKVLPLHDSLSNSVEELGVFSIVQQCTTWVNSGNFK